MFLNQTILNRLMKEAVKLGMRVWRSDEEIYIGGLYWSAIINEKFMPKETKGNLISLVGELPESGHGYIAYKEGNQMELATKDLFMKEPGTHPLEVTDTIQIAPDGTHQRILQDASTGQMCLINNVFVSIIDEGIISDNDGEYAPGKPMLERNGTCVSWANNVCIFSAMLRTETSDVEDILNRLKGVDLMTGRV